jgi:hypothetical protein
MFRNVGGIMNAEWLRARLGVVALLVALALACGCGGPRTVTGKVTYASKPLKKGQISFVGANGKSASGTINDDGSYLVTNVPAGEVTVVVVSYFVEGENKFGLTPLKSAPPMKSAIPTKYNDPATSGLRYTLDSSRKTIHIELTD